jgi:hypothetical protein
LVTFAGVYLLNLSRRDPSGRKLASGVTGEDATGTDMISSIQTRLSMSSRRSADPSRHSISSEHGDRQGLIRAYDEEEASGFGLTDLAEDSDDDMQRTNGGKYNENIELENQKKKPRT